MDPVYQKGQESIYRGQQNVAGGGSVSGAQNDAIDAPMAIRNGLHNVESLVAAVHSCIDIFEKRFEAVLLPVPPSTTGQNPVPTPGRQPASHVTNRLQDIHETLGNAIARMQHLIARADV